MKKGTEITYCPQGLNLCSCGGVGLGVCGSCGERITVDADQPRFARDEWFVPRIDGDFK